MLVRPDDGGVDALILFSGDVVLENQVERLGVITTRDENGAETDGTKWCHIHFHIFMRKQK
jgi:hypothetical protein